MNNSIPSINIHTPKHGHDVSISLQEFNRQQPSTGGEGPPPPHLVRINASGGDGLSPMVRINNTSLLTASLMSGEKGALGIPHQLFFPGGDLRPPRNRKPNYSENEKQLFFALIGPHVDILDAKSQERQIMNMKTELWKEITLKYNEIILKLSGNYVCRDSEELKTFWKNVRRTNRRKSSYDIGDLAYKRWRDLRDRYVKERKKETNFISQSGEPYKSRWELMPHLHFLQDTIRHRENFNNPFHIISITESSTLVNRKQSYPNEEEDEIQADTVEDEIESIEIRNRNNFQDYSTSLEDIHHHLHTTEGGQTRNHNYFDKGIPHMLCIKDDKDLIITNVLVPDLNERMGMEGSSTPSKIEGASSSFVTCSPLISSITGIHEDISSGAGPSSCIQNSNENDGEYDDDTIDVKTEPVFNVQPEICEEENSQSNTQSSSDRRSHQSSPTPSMIGPYLLKKETHCTTILDQLLRDDTFSDVTLTAEGQSIRAHKIVLCLASNYFRQVLSKESNVQNVIVFRDVKFAELKNLINFIYTGEATVDAADLESFMKTAEMLEVTSLCDGQRNFPKNLLPKLRESETDKAPSSTPVKTTFPASKRSHASSSAAGNGSPPTKSRKTDGKDTSKKSSVLFPHPSTSGGGGGTSSNSIIEPITTIIKTEPISEDSIVDEDYELKVGADVSFESLTRSPPGHVTTDLGENQSPASDPLSSSSTSLEKVPVGKCPFCPSAQPTRKGSELTKHMYAHHQDKTVFCCETCSRVFLKKGSFEAHKDDCKR